MAITFQTILFSKGLLNKVGAYTALLGRLYTIRHACHACLIVYGRKNLSVRQPDAG